MMDDQTKDLSRSKNLKSRDTSLGNIQIDYDLLGRELEVSNLSEDEKKEFIDCICWIMLSFVDLGFGISSTQQAILAGQADNKDKPAPVMPFMDMIMAYELSEEFKSNTDGMHIKTKKEPMSKGRKI